MSEQRLVSQHDGPVDEEILAELFMVMDDGPSEDLMSICDLFLTGVPARLSDIGSALGEDRIYDASKAAHSLKGTGGAFGARRLGEVAGRLEQACRHSDAVAAAALLHELHAEFRIFRDILQARLTTRSASRNGRVPAPSGTQSGSTSLDA